MPLPHSIRKSTHPSTYLSTHTYIHLSAHPSPFHPSIHQAFHSFVKVNGFPRHIMTSQWRHRKLWTRHRRKSSRSLGCTLIRIHSVVMVTEPTKSTDLHHDLDLQTTTHFHLNFHHSTMNHHHNNLTTPSDQRDKEECLLKYADDSLANGEWFIE